YRLSCCCSHQPATSNTSTLSLHDALPISRKCPCRGRSDPRAPSHEPRDSQTLEPFVVELVLTLKQAIEPSQEVSRLRPLNDSVRSEEHTSELQSLRHLVCRLLLEKKKKYS